MRRVETGHSGEIGLCLAESIGVHAMPGTVWELWDIKVGPSGNPPDTIIARIPYVETTPKEAREDAIKRLRSHKANKSSVQGIVIADANGETVVRVTLWDIL